MNSRHINNMMKKLGLYLLTAIMAVVPMLACAQADSTVEEQGVAVIGENGDPGSSLAALQDLTADGEAKGEKAYPYGAFLNDGDVFPEGEAIEMQFTIENPSYSSCHYTVIVFYGNYTLDDLADDDIFYSSYVTSAESTTYYESTLVTFTWGGAAYSPAGPYTIVMLLAIPNGSDWNTVNGVVGHLTISDGGSPYIPDDPEPTVSVRFKQDSYTLTSGDIIDMADEIVSDSLAKVTLETKDGAIAGINGLSVTGKQAGTVTVYASIGSVSDSCTVKVTDPAGTLALPEALKKISEDAFTSSGAEKVVVPEGCGTIEAGAFASMKDLKVVDLPKSLTSIDTAVFDTASDALFLVNGKSTAAEYVKANGFRCLFKDDDSGLSVPAFKGLASEHPYAPNTDQTWTYSIADAKALDVTFSYDTETEEGYDFIYLYDGNGNECLKASGKELAGQTITVPDSTVRIRLTSNGSGNAYGFRVTSVSKADPSSITYRAYCVGQAYSGSSNQLNGTLNDRDAVVSMLGTMSATPYSVTKGTDLTATEIINGIKSTFANAKSTDVSFFYYSGHGSSDGSLCGFNSSTHAITTISPTTLRSALDTIPGKKVVMIDACYSGAMIGKDAEAAAADFVESFNENFISAFAAAGKSNLAADNYFVLTAASGSQTSVEYYDGSTHFGLFTSSMTYGCGWNERAKTKISSLYADKNGDRKLTLSEVYEYTVDYINSTHPNVQATQCWPMNSSQILYGR